MLTFSYHLTRPGQVQDVVICLHDTWTLYEDSILIIMMNLKIPFLHLCFTLLSFASLFIAN